MKDKIHMDVKVLISGRITGENIKSCFEKFETAKNNLSNLFELQGWTDYTIYTPFDLEDIYFGIEHHKAMEITLNTLKDCNMIYVLQDWRMSHGAKIEYEYALENNLEILFE